MATSFGHNGHHQAISQKPKKADDFGLYVPAFLSFYEMA